MLINWNAAAIVANGHRIIGVQLDLNAVGIAGHRLVHRIVQHLSHQMMQGPLIRATYIHPRAFADRL